MRAALAVFVGFAVWSILWVGGNQALAAALPEHFAEDGSTAHAGLLVGILGMSVLWSVLSGWLTASVGRATGPRLPLILGVVLLAVGLAVQIGYWDVMPVWYHLAFLALLVPGCLVGGRLRAPAVAAA
jgi:hypothetical protein